MHKGARENKNKLVDSEEPSETSRPPRVTELGQA